MTLIPWKTMTTHTQSKEGFHTCGRDKNVQRKASMLMKRPCKPSGIGAAPGLVVGASHWANIKVFPNGINCCKMCCRKAGMSMTSIVSERISSSSQYPNCIFQRPCASRQCKVCSSLDISVTPQQDTRCRLTLVEPIPAPQQHDIHCIAHPFCADNHKLSAYYLLPTHWSNEDVPSWMPSMIVMYASKRL